MQIGELATQGDVSVQTVRFYERRGLLPNPPRKESGYRIYGEPDLRRLLFIRQAKALGFSLEDIREVFRMRERGQCPCGKVLAMAERHLQNVELHIGQLSRFRNELRQAVRDWRRSGDQQLSGDAFCTLIENTLSLRSRRSKRGNQ